MRVSPSVSSGRRKPSGRSDSPCSAIARLYSAPRRRAARSASPAARAASIARANDSDAAQPRAAAVPSAPGSTSSGNALPSRSRTTRRVCSRSITARPVPAARSTVQSTYSSVLARSTSTVSAPRAIRSEAPWRAEAPTPRKHSSLPEASSSSAPMASAQRIPVRWPEFGIPTA